MSDMELAYRATLDGSGFASGAQTINGHLSDMGIRTGSATANLGGLGMMLGTMANPLTAVAIGLTAVGGGLASAVGTAAGFQAAMSRVASVSGANAAELTMMSDAAREAGATTVFSASQAADAMYFLASSGMTAQQQITALPETLNLASAGGMDLARAAEIVTSTLAQFGLKAEDTGRVSNVLAAGAAKSNVDIMQLGNAMNYVGPVAAALGYSVEETTAALGMLGNAGLKGEQGGTVLRGALSALLQPSKLASGALAEMGLSVDDVNPSMVSLSDIVGTLEEKHMTAAQAVAIFGREAGPGMLGLVSQGSGALKKLEADITGTNKASEMSAQMTNNLNGAWAEFSSATEEAGIALGNVLLPAITDIVQSGTGLVTFLTDSGKAAYEMWEGVMGAGRGGEQAILGWSNWLSSIGFGGVPEETGAQVAEGMATGIEENKDVVTSAIKDATGGPDAKAAVTKSADDLAKEFTKAYGSQFEAGMTLINGKWISNMESAAGDFSKYVGSSTIGGFTFSLDNWALKLNTPLGEYNFDSSQDMMNRFPVIMSEILGRALSPLEKAELSQDIAAQIKLKAQIQPELDQYWLLDEAAKAESDWEALGEKWTSALKDGMLMEAERDELLGLAKEIRMLEQTSPELFYNVGGDSGKAFLDAIQSQDWSSVAKMAGSIFGESFGQNMYAAALDYFGYLEKLGINLGTALGSSAKLGDVEISNLGRYITAQRNELMSELKGYYEKGESYPHTAENIAKMDQMISVIEKYGGQLDARDMQWLDLAKDWRAGDLQASDKLAELMGVATEKISSKVDRGNSLLEKTAANTKDTCNFCEAMSEFGMAQEEAWAEMGLGTSSFIGSTADYKKFLEEEYAAGAYHPAPVTVGFDYKSEMEAYMKEQGLTMKVGLDTTQAGMDLLGLTTDVEKETKKPITIDDAQAMRAISAIDAAASRSVTKNVYVNEIGGGDTGQGYNQAWDQSYAARSNPSESWLSFANEGFVSRPTLAIIGDRPGGEYVLGADRINAMLQGGGIKIEISSPVNINAPIYGVEDLQGVIEENNRKLTQEIADAMRGL